MTHLRIVVYGRPGPQGSKRALGPGRMVEQSPHVGPWREAVRAAARAEMQRKSWVTIPRGTAVGLHINFLHQRPASHYGTGRNADTLKPTAPTWKTTAPDLSKLIRSTEDALTDAGVWADDALVAQVSAIDQWTTGLTHAIVTVWVLSATKES